MGRDVEPRVCLALYWMDSIVDSSFFGCFGEAFVFEIYCVEMVISALDSVYCSLAIISSHNRTHIRLSSLSYLYLWCFCDPLCLPLGHLPATADV